MRGIRSRRCPCCDCSSASTAVVVRLAVGIRSCGQGAEKRLVREGRDRTPRRE
jgi:hypothetical protein